MTMGFKISRQKLQREEAKKVVIVGACQYIADSLYSIGSYLPEFQVYAASLINVFSIFMICALLMEAKKNFDQINLRYHLVTQSQTPGLNYLRRTLLVRKKLISAITLTAVFYFTCELLFHGLWDIYL